MHTAYLIISVFPESPPAGSRSAVRGESFLVWAARKLLQLLFGQAPPPKPYASKPSDAGIIHGPSVMAIPSFNVVLMISNQGAKSMRFSYLQHTFDGPQATGETWEEAEAKLRKSLKEDSAWRWADHALSQIDMDWKALNDPPPPRAEAV